MLRRHVGAKETCILGPGGPVRLSPNPSSRPKLLLELYCTEILQQAVQSRRPAVGDEHASAGPGGLRDAVFPRQESSGLRWKAPRPGQERGRHELEVGTLWWLSR